MSSWQMLSKLNEGKKSIGLVIKYDPVRISVDCQNTDTILNFKSQIANLKNIDGERISLIHGGKLMDNHKTIADHALQNGNEIILWIKPNNLMARVNLNGVLCDIDYCPSNTVFEFNSKIATDINTIGLYCRNKLMKNKKTMDNYSNVELNIKKSAYNPFPHKSDDVSVEPPQSLFMSTL